MGAEIFPKRTYEEFQRLPDDGKRHELIHGEVHVRPSPGTRHQWVLQNLDISLGIYVRMENAGEVWVAPLEVRLSDDTALQPDLIYVSNA